VPPGRQPQLADLLGQRAVGEVLGGLGAVGPVQHLLEVQELGRGRQRGQGQQQHAEATRGACCGSQGGEHGGDRVVAVCGSSMPLGTRSKARNHGWLARDPVDPLPAAHRGHRAAGPAVMSGLALIRGRCRAAASTALMRMPSEARRSGAPAETSVNDIAACRLHAARNGKPLCNLVNDSG
jgi:hypothetical protein